ncbi:MAG: SUMF1/EgtB/PvdO family nonheme iron enzyme [Planctomycetes bacterium]|nr:SUMF1/EgtB/PvdO family nonheme iron enzyme [Planctomycetota bacterium]
MSEQKKDPEDGAASFPLPVDGSPANLATAQTLRPGADPPLTLRPEVPATLPPSPSTVGHVPPTVGAGGGPAATPAGGDAQPAYEILGELGRGGMGVVYRVFQNDLRREVAMKVLGDANPEVREKFVAESRVGGQLEHPGIVPVYGLLTTGDGEVALLMKLVRGKSWSDLLHASDPSEARDLDFHLEVLLHVSNAVAFAHSKGLSHNDLKPANVMVGEFGEALVADWGLAVDMRDEPSPNSVAPHKSTIASPAGTPAYWPPELARGDGRAIGPWTDVYLLGSILYELANGRPPYGGKDVLTAIRAATSDTPPPFDPTAPGGLVEICRRAMAPAPRDRFANVPAFRDALRAFLKNRESLRLAREAAVTLERAIAGAAAPENEDEGRASAARAVVYADFAEAAHGFRQAILLWADNREALEGERRACLLLAELALRNGDLGLAEAQLSRLDKTKPEVAGLLGRVHAAAEERKRAARSARALRRGLAASLAAIVLGLTTALVIIRAAQRRAEENHQLATERLANIRRLSDVQLLSERTAEAEELWPALPDNVAAMEAWVREARALAGRLAGHRAYLEQLRTGATRSPAGFRFATSEEQWEHDTLAALVTGLERLAGSTIRDVEQRIAFAQDVRRLTLEEPRKAWEEGVRSIADRAECPAYGGLRLAPQLGLIPLGKDHASGLWEFAHLASGEPARRGADGRLELTEGTGVVLVLLPGGTFAMGARPPDAQHPPGSANVDPEARPSEGPVHDLTLAPFFLAKHELTQGQWVRAVGKNPSAYPAGVEIGGHRHTLLHPVELIDWVEAKRAMSRLALCLPTEAQWEYAARGGTTTAYFTGADKESLAGSVNLADRYCKENGGPGSWQFELWLNDGFVVHAPVGSYRPNAFGLHELVGNVWEWVEDPYGGYDLPVRPGDGLRQGTADTPRVFRGGGFRSNAVHARSADRYTLYAPGYRGFDVGVRAARGVQ